MLPVHQPFSEEDNVPGFWWDANFRIIWTILMVQNSHSLIVQMLRPWEFQITVDLNHQKAVYLQITDHIIEAIKQGKLKTGDALPGSRKLASQIKVNRNTVVKALDVLLAEGWVETAERKGVFVSEASNTPALKQAPRRLPVH